MITKEIIYRLTYGIKIRADFKDGIEFMRPDGTPVLLISWHDVSDLIELLSRLKKKADHGGS